VALVPTSSRGTGGGGSSGFTGCILTLLNCPVADFAAGRVPFDTVAYDSGGFADIANSRVVVPVALPGWYRVTFTIIVAAFDPMTQTYFTPYVRTSGDPDNGEGVAVDRNDATQKTCLVSYVMGPLVAGDNMDGRLAWVGGGVVVLSGAGGEFVCQYLGPAA
jgi:hypothetical protein